MVEVWFALLCFMLTVFVVLDGWNIGAGVLHLIAGRTRRAPRDRCCNRALLELARGLARGVRRDLPACLPESHGHFVRRVLPRALVRALVVHPARRVHRGRRPHPRQALAVLVGLRLRRVERVLAVLFGAALGNVIRGVPLDESGKFSMSLFTDFGVRGRVGILDWYTVSVAVFTTVLLAAHGATYLRLKTTARVHQRSERLARWLWAAALVLFAVVSLETWIVRPALYGAMVERPLAWLAIAVVVAGAWGLVTGLSGTGETRAFAGSCAVIAGLLAGAAVACIPVILHSTLGTQHSMTAYNGAAPGVQPGRGFDLVAGGARPRAGVFHRHYAELPRQGQAGGGHPGVLLTVAPAAACSTCAKSASVPRGIGIDGRGC